MPIAGRSEENFDEVELGWTLKAGTWGHGYATEAARACLDWGGRDLGRALPHLERLGFRPLRQDELFGLFGRLTVAP
ncbi:GNAT family N-acetyltransferase [Streptomyces sp. NPDC056660]|uniref:GNAT family N-acetyltransferase n=1 Tax=Streptomyces sp. NPDC056660 TaxID=3345897 RepID=UPI0036ACEF49